MFVIVDGIATQTVTRPGTFPIYLSIYQWWGWFINQIFVIKSKSDTMAMNELFD